MTTPKPEAATPEQVNDVRELIERLREMAPKDGKAIRCAGRTTAMMNTDIRAAATALTAALEREEALREAIPDDIELFRILQAAGRSDREKAAALNKHFAPIRNALENTNGN